MESTESAPLKRTTTQILEISNRSDQRKKSAVLTRYPSRLVRLRKNDFEFGGPNDWLQNFLSYDILIAIFKTLPRKDQSTVSKVCRYWRYVTQDPIFGWGVVTRITLELQSNHNSNMPKVIPEELYLKKQPKDTPHNFMYKPFDIVNSQGEILCQVKIYNVRKFPTQELGQYLSPEVENVIQLCADHPNLFRQHVSFSKEPQTCVLIMECHVHEFESLVRKGEVPPGLSYIITGVGNENEKVTEERIKKMIGDYSCKVPMRSNIPIKQPDNLRQGLNLYKYQLDAVTWMKSIEEDIASKIPIKYTPLIPWRSVKSEILFNMENRTVVTYNKISEHIRSFYPKGAILADEVGLGKTIELLALILSNPPTDEEKVNTEKIYCRATLVICPNHLVQQWNQELQKNSEPPLKIIKLTTMSELSACSYEAIKGADVILASFQLLGNGNYYKIGSTKEHVGKERSAWVNDLLHKVKKSHHLKELPLLEHFYWHRLILDEAHEVIAGDFAHSLFDARFKWYVSGTPIPNEYVGVMLQLTSEEKY